MQKSVDALGTKGRTVLNVGFGLGIIDSIIQETGPSHHTIIEAHPDVYQRMVELGWDKKPNVTILFGRWQDVTDKLEQYECIYFDTFGEYYDDLHEFHEILPNILAEDGVYSFFNGLGGTNQFFHDVYCDVCQCDLNEMGLVVEFKEFDVDALGDDVWCEIKRAYWSLPKYRLPIIKFDPSLYE
jgi:protein arginine N-methyltransferase 2